MAWGLCHASASTWQHGSLVKKGAMLGYGNMHPRPQSNPDSQPETQPQRSAATQQDQPQHSLAVPALLLLAGCLLYLPWLGSYGPLDPTDSFFIESGREILETDKWLLPLQNYQPWLDKPILYFWAVAGSYKLLGVSPLAGRLVSALSGVALGLVTYFFSLPYLKQRDAALAAVIFLAFPLSCAIGHVSLTDMPLALLTSTAQLALYHFEKRGKLSSWLIAYTALALAFLCKGPIALVIVAAIYGLYWLLTCPSLSKIPGKILKTKPFAGLALIAAINLPWYTAATIGTNGKFFQDFFITQNFGRMTGTVNHQQPFWFYIPVLLGGIFPWSLLLFGWPHKLQKKLSQTQGPTTVWLQSLKRIWQQRHHLNERRDFIFFSWTWAILVLVLFSAIKTKLPTYILPAMPPLAILVADRLSYLLRTKRCLHLLPSSILVLATMIGALYASFKSHGWVGRFLTDERLIIVLALAAALAYLTCLLRGKVKAGLTVLLALSIAASGLLVPQAHIAFYKERQEPFEGLIRKIQQGKATVATVVVEAPSLSYYLHKHIPCLSKEAECRRFMVDSTAPRMVLVPKELAKESQLWFDHLRVIDKTPNGKWTLYYAD